MSSTSQYDLVIIGAGIAGLTAAVRAGQLGLKACVLEKSGAERYPCNTRFSGGTLHVCLRDIMTDASELRAAIDNVTHNSTPTALADAIATDGRRLVRWLQGEGIRFVKASPQAYQNWVLAPPRPARPGLHWEGRGGDVLLRTLGELINKRGGKLVRNARARSLLMHGERCIGVRAEVDGQSVSFDATAVLIADGGFQGNAALVGEHISARPERLKQRGAGTAVGDGLLMAREIGAQLTRLDSFYGHVLSRDAMSNDALWPYPVIDSIAAAAITVDAQGKRFADESESGVYLANAIAKLADPLGAFAILDDAIWNGAGKRDLIPVNPHLQNCGGTVLQAQSVEVLATAAGLPSAALAATVQTYNDAVKQGHTARLSPARRSDQYAPQLIERPPFYAIPLCAGITYTMGGIAVNEHACVLNASGAPIPGLYAAGSCVGGVDGGPTAGYVGGLSKAGVLGLRCAEHFAHAVQESSA